MDYRDRIKKSSLKHFGDEFYCDFSESLRRQISTGESKVMAIRDGITHGKYGEYRVRIRPDPSLMGKRIYMRCPTRNMELTRIYSDGLRQPRYSGDGDFDYFIALMTEELDSMIDEYENQRIMTSSTQAWYKSNLFKPPTSPEVNININLTHKKTDQVLTGKGGIRARLQADADEWLRDVKP